MRMARLNVAHLRRGGRNSLSARIRYGSLFLAGVYLLMTTKSGYAPAHIAEAEREKERRGHHLIMYQTVACAYKTDAEIAHGKELRRIHATAAYSFSSYFGTHFSAFIKVQGNGNAYS